MVWGFVNRSGVRITTTLDNGEGLTSVSDAGGVWRQLLPATAASTLPHTLTVKSDDGHNATLSNILFGDVYICGGQSNMAFSLPANANASAEVAAATAYTSIRVFTVGTKTSQ